MKIKVDWNIILVNGEKIPLSKKVPIMPPIEGGIILGEKWLVVFSHGRPLFGEIIMATYSELEIRDEDFQYSTEGPYEPCPYTKLSNLSKEGPIILKADGYKITSCSYLVFTLFAFYNGKVYVEKQKRKFKLEFVC